MRGREIYEPGTLYRVVGIGKSDAFHEVGGAVIRPLGAIVRRRKDDQRWSGTGKAYGWFDVVVPSPVGFAGDDEGKTCFAEAYLEQLNQSEVKAMSTRSRIGIIYEDGSIRSVYCHMDGYPSGVGQTLLDHWNTGQECVDILLDGGDMSSLGKDSVTTGYYKDRGDKDVDAQVHENIAAFERDYAYDMDYEWCYLFDVSEPEGCGGAWIFRPHSYTPKGAKLKKPRGWAKLKKTA